MVKLKDRQETLVIIKLAWKILLLTLKHILGQIQMNIKGLELILNLLASIIQTSVSNKDSKIVTEQQASIHLFK